MPAPERRSCWRAAARRAPSFTGEERFAFPEPYGEQEVHLVPHPEPVTLPRTIDVRDVVFKVGYPADETARIRVLLELGFDRDEPFEVDGVAVSPRRFAAAYIGRRGIGPTERSANVKHVRVEGAADGRPVTLTYDFAVEQVGRSASAAITGTVAAIAADLVARGGPAGVHPPEAAFDPRPFVDALAERGPGRRSKAHARAGDGLTATRRSVAGDSSSIVCSPGGSSRSGRTAAIARAPVGG